jgi:hypothetical protein
VPPLAEVELTDAMMEEYVGLVAEWRKRTQAGDHGLAWLTGRGWNLERWAYIQAGVAQAGMLMATGGMSEAAARYDQTIADLEARLGGASGAQRDLVQAQLEAARQGREAMRGAARDVQGYDTPVGRKNLATLQRWLPRIQEASR